MTTPDPNNSVPMDLTTDQLHTAMLEFAHQRDGNGLEDHEDAWYYQSCMILLDQRIRTGDLPTAWTPTPTPIAPPADTPADGDAARLAVQQWLTGYAWMGTTDEKTRNVACIMSQDDWTFVAERADRFAGAQFEHGPQTTDESMGYALSSLYECHDGPHLPDCPSLTGYEHHRKEQEEYNRQKQQQEG